METYKEKVLNYFAEKRREELTDVDFFAGNMRPDFTEEDLYKELWDCINAKDEPDKEVLGERSI